MYRAVIVDDEPLMLEGMRLMIDWRGCGFELCGEAGSAQEALRLADALRPHLLITDVRMPGMPGTDLATVVRHYHPEVVVLLFSVLKDFRCAQSAIRSRVFDYLVKPIDPDEVHGALRRVKAELDARARREADLAGRWDLLLDQVLRRAAFGDDSRENLMRAGVLLDVRGGDPCYAAVLSGRAAVPEGARLMIGACGAAPFQLAPSQYGLRLRGIERDLPLLERLLTGFSGAAVALSVGRVYRGAEGFGRSLREALDAQGVLFEPHRELRLYRPVDWETARWLAGLPLSHLRDALADRDPGALEALLGGPVRQAASAAPGPFALRYMAASLDAMVPAGGAAEGAPLRALWQQEMSSRDEWFDAFAAALRQLRRAAGPSRADGWPQPVQAAVAMIRTRYAQPLSLAEVAGSLGINPAYLGQLVRRHAGATFHRLLLDARMERASLLLRQTARPVGEIALEVGFRDVEYFSQQFRGRTGMSPVAYRSAEPPKEERHAPQ